jgi:hypothetical protein
MEKAAKKADNLGRNHDAQELRKEISNYQRSIPFRLGSRNDVYGMIEDWLSEDPNLTYQQIKKTVADYVGDLVSEVCKNYPRMQKVFREAKRKAQKEQELRETYLTRIGMKI